MGGEFGNKQQRYIAEWLWVMQFLLLCEESSMGGGGGVGEVFPWTPIPWDWTQYGGSEGQRRGPKEHIPPHCHQYSVTPAEVPAEPRVDQQSPPGKQLRRARCVPVPAQLSLHGIAFLSSLV